MKFSTQCCSFVLLLSSSASEASGVRGHNRGLQNSPVCPQPRPGTMCTMDYNPVVCGIFRCEYSNGCVASTAGYEIEEDCELVNPPATTETPEEETPEVETPEEEPEEEEETPKEETAKEETPEEEPEEEEEPPQEETPEEETPEEETPSVAVDGTVELSNNDATTLPTCQIQDPLYQFVYDDSTFTGIPFHKTFAPPDNPSVKYPPHDSYPGDVYQNNLQAVGVPPILLNVHYAGKCARRQNTAFLAGAPIMGPDVCSIESQARPYPQLETLVDNIDTIAPLVMERLAAGGQQNGDIAASAETTEAATVRQGETAPTCPPAPPEAYAVQQEQIDEQVQILRILGRLLQMPQGETNRTINAMVGCQMQFAAKTCRAPNVVELLDVLTKCSFQDSEEFGANAPALVQNFNPGFNDSFYQMYQPPAGVVDSFFDGPEDEIGLNWMANDVMFGYMRLTGAAPDVLRLATLEDVGPNSFPVTDQMWQTTMDTMKTLNESIADGEVYILDYSALEAIEGTNGDKIMFSPKALFGIDDDDILTVVAIQVWSDPAHEDNDVLSPPLQRKWEEATDSEKVDLLKWSLAKVAVNSAEASYFELVTHLGLTHLVMEPIIIGAKRSLPADHPISMLLKNHIFGTISINEMAAQMLMAPGYTIDHAFPPEIGVSQAVAVDAVKGFLANVNDQAFPTRMERNGVMDIPEYPYRDDGMLEWEAMYDFVEEFLDVVYDDDEAVANDGALECWASELREGGRMNNFGSEGSNQFTTKEGLRDFLTLFMFTASCQHSATNYAQGVYVYFAPIMPLSGYANPHDVTEENLEEMTKYQGLPKERWVQFDGQNVLYLLQSVRWYRLGDYVKDLDGSSVELFDGDYLKAVENYRKELEKVGKEIDKRNNDAKTLRGSLLPYELLHPANVPQSIHI